MQIDLFLYIRQLQTEILFLVHYLQHKSEYKRRYSEAGEPYERIGIVVRCGGCLGIDSACIELHREEPQTDILYPEYKSVCRADYFAVDQLRYARPERRRHKRERRAEYQYRYESYNDTTYLIAFEHRQYESKRQMADD